MSTLDEPMPGWIDNFYGPIGLFVGGGKGVLHVACVKSDVWGDIIPADVVIKLLIVLIWKRALTVYDHQHMFYVNRIRFIYEHLTLILILPRRFKDLPSNDFKYNFSPRKIRSRIF